MTFEIKGNHFFKDGETIDLSLIENFNNINCIKIMPLENDYHFEKIINIKIHIVKTLSYFFPFIDILCSTSLLQDGQEK